MDNPRRATAGTGTRQVELSPPSLQPRPQPQEPLSRGRVRRIETQCLAKIGRRRQLSHLPIGHTTIGVDGGGAWRDVQRSGIVPEGLIEFPAVGERVRQIHVEDRTVLPFAQAGPVVLDCRRTLAPIGKDVSELDVRVGEIRLDAQCFAVLVHGLVRAAELASAIPRL